MFITRTSSLYILGKQHFRNKVWLNTFAQCHLLLGNLPLLPLHVQLHAASNRLFFHVEDHYRPWKLGFWLWPAVQTGVFLLWESPVLKGIEIRNMFVGLFPWVTLTKQASDQASEEGNKRKMNSCTWQQELAQHWKQSSTNPDQGYIL